jgi:hypothetical protein
VAKDNSPGSDLPKDWAQSKRKMYKNKLKTAIKLNGKKDCFR